MAFENLLVSIVSNLDDSGFKALDRMETRANKTTKILSNSLRSMFIGVVGTIGVKEIVDASVKLDSLNKSFAALAGSDIGGKEQLEYVRKEADRLGQSFVTTANAYKNLFAAGKGANMANEDIQAVYSSVLEAGTVLGSSDQQVQSALMALEQMISKGKVSAEELRRQLGNALPGTMQRAAKAMGTTTEGLEEMMKKGIDAQKFVKAFSRELHNEFGGQADAVAVDSLNGALNRLNNAIFDLKTAFLGEDSEELAKIINEIAKLLKDPALHKALKSIGQLAIFVLKNFRLLFGVATILGIKRLIFEIKILKDNFTLTSFAARRLAVALRMDAGIASVKTLTKVSWGLIAPWLRILLILFLVAEVVDTLRGKRTVLGELFENAPTLSEVGHSKKFQKQKLENKKYIDKMLNPYYKPVPVLYDASQYDKDGNFMGPNGNPIGGAAGISDSILNDNSGYVGTLPNLEQKANKQNRIGFGDITININTSSDNPQEIGQAVKTAFVEILDDYSLLKGYPQTESA